MIKKIKAREILNSRGNPTVEVELETNKGVFKASVPSGASTGKNEAKEINVFAAIKNINGVINRKLKGQNEADQTKIDNLLIEMDGTKDKSNLGANAILAVSIAVCRAGAQARKIPLYKYIRKLSNKTKGWQMPKPCFNVINGGAHAGNKLDIQEFMIIPQEKTFIKNLRKGAALYHDLEEKIEKRFGEQSTNLGDEGGFCPEVGSSLKILDLLKNLVKNKNAKIGLDAAASQFYSKKKYKLEGRSLSPEKLLVFYSGLVKKYPLIFIEDPFDEEDWDSFKKITAKLGRKTAIIGDDLLTTNIQRIKEAGEKKACNGAIIKPNQIGTVSETLEAIKLTKSYNWKVMVSHRSGETLDDFIADLAIGAGADYIKAGAPARGERLAKYNRLLKIEEELNL